MSEQRSGHEYNIASKNQVFFTFFEKDLEGFLNLQGALCQGLASGMPRVMVAEGDIHNIREYLSGPASEVRMHPGKPVISQADQDMLKEKTLHRLRLLSSEITKFGIDAIDSEEPLESYGIDSIMIAQFNHQLAGIFGEMSKTLFYEYRTFGELAEHFVTEHPQDCMRWTGLGDRVQPEASPHVSSSNGEFPLLTPFREKKTAHRGFPVARLISPKSGPISPILTPILTPGEPIAIIGISGRYPQAGTLEEYWENLKAGRDCITEIPGERWNWKDWYHENREEAVASGKSYGKWGAFLEEFAQFDPIFFNMTPREAENTDPQERLFLEECWKVFEDAGYAPSSLSPELRQRTGVFGGITKQGFNLHGVNTRRNFPSTSFSSLVNRVSYVLNLQGPSIPIDTMCSSALAAIHEACEHIRTGRCDLAIAGGVNLYVHPSAYVGLSRMQILSDTSESAAFGKKGNGFVPGEGVGVVLLKALSKAVRDGDGIYALIRGTAVNHDGKTANYTTPSLNQQVAVIQQALEQNNTDPRTVSYIEAAANGSEMGDAIEMTALTKVFGNRTGVRGDYRIGSVKPGIGHCEAASGMSQLTKVILQLANKTLVPTLITGDPNPNIDFDQLPFQLQREISEWNRVTADGCEAARRAGITGIGAGGVNAHVIVEEYIPETVTSHKLPGKTGPLLFVLSAKDKDALKNYVRQWIPWLEKNQHPDPESIIFTLQTGREEMPCRLAVVAAGQQELLHHLEQWTEHRENTNCCFFGDLKNNRVPFSKDISQTVRTEKPEELAK